MCGFVKPHQKLLQLTLATLDYIIEVAPTDELPEIEENLKKLEKRIRGKLLGKGYYRRRKSNKASFMGIFDGDDDFPSEEELLKLELEELEKDEQRS